MTRAHFLAFTRLWLDRARYSAEPFRTAWRNSARFCLQTAADLRKVEKMA